jgi:hypothetical protein
MKTPVLSTVFSYHAKRLCGEELEPITIIVRESYEEKGGYEREHRLEVSLCKDKNNRFWLVRISENDVYGSPTDTSFEKTELSSDQAAFLKEGY